QRQEAQGERVAEGAQDDPGGLLDRVGRTPPTVAARRVGHDATTSAWGAALFMRVRSHCIWTAVSGSQASTTARRSRSRAPCAAWPTTVQLTSHSQAMR